MTSLQSQGPARYSAAGPASPGDVTDVTDKFSGFDGWLQEPEEAPGEWCYLFFLNDDFTAIGDFTKKRLGDLTKTS